MPTYVLLGFDNGPADFYASGGADPGTTQWYQWHGFGTSAFSNLDRQTPYTTTHNMSWYRHADQNGLMKSYGNYLQNSYFSYAFYNGGAATKAVPSFATSTPTRGFIQTTPTFGATQPTVASNEIFNFASSLLLRCPKKIVTYLFDAFFFLRSFLNSSFFERASILLFI